MPGGCRPYQSVALQEIGQYQHTTVAARDPLDYGHWPKLTKLTDGTISQSAKGAASVTTSQRPFLPDCSARISSRTRWAGRAGFVFARANLTAPAVDGKAVNYALTVVDRVARCSDHERHFQSISGVLSLLWLASHLFLCSRNRESTEKCCECYEAGYHLHRHKIMLAPLVSFKLQHSPSFVATTSTKTP